MKIIIYWKTKDSKTLYNYTQEALDTLWLSELIIVETSTASDIKKRLKITKSPALIVQENTIDFEDIIFEWMVPKKEEIVQMVVDIIWWEAGNLGWGCSPVDCTSCWPGVCA